MITSELQGWYEDPFQRHDARYFSAGRPTKLVRDGNAESYDEPPEGERGSGAAVSGGASVPGDHAVSAALRPAEANGPYPPGDDMPANFPRRSRPGLLATAAVIAIAGAVTAVVIASKPGHATVPMSPVAFVTQSVQRTLSAHTADITVSGSEYASGKGTRISGAGQTDFRANSIWLNTTTSSSGHTTVEKEIVVKGNLYLATYVDGKSSSSKLTGGRTWIQTPLQQSGSAVPVGSDPGAYLAVLKQQGNTVRPLGTKVIDGVTCTGYSVTRSRQAMIADFNKEAGTLKKGTSDAESLGAFMKMFASMLQPTLTVWFDSHGLLRQMSAHLSMQLGMGSSNNPINVDMVFDFTNYGAPVRITAPPPSETISSSEFLKKLGLGSLRSWAAHAL